MVTDKVLLACAGGKKRNWHVTVPETPTCGVLVIIFAWRGQLLRTAPLLILLTSVARSERLNLLAINDIIVLYNPNKYYTLR